MKNFIRRSLGFLLVLLCSSNPLPAQAPGPFLQKWAPSERTKVVKIEFVNPFDNSDGSALLELPARLDGPVPLFVSPHGANWSPESNRSLWTGVADELGVLVLHPTHQGKLTPAVSLGGDRQMANLEAAVAHVEKRYPVDVKRIYAGGISQGATESLLLGGRKPERYAGVLAINPVADFSAFYEDAPGFRQLLEKDFGGTPREAAEEYARRSPVTYAEQLARLPVILYWADNDELIPRGESRQGGRLSDLIEAAKPAFFRQVRHSKQHGYPFFRVDSKTKQLEVFERATFLASVKELLDHKREP